MSARPQEEDEWDTERDGGRTLAPLHRPLERDPVVVVPRVVLRRERDPDLVAGELGRGRERKVGVERLLDGELVGASRERDDGCRRRGGWCRRGKAAQAGERERLVREEVEEVEEEVDAPGGARAVQLARSGRRAVRRRLAVAWRGRQVRLARGGSSCAGRRRRARSFRRRLGVEAEAARVEACHGQLMSLLRSTAAPCEPSPKGLGEGQLARRASSSPNPPRRRESGRTGCRPRSRWPGRCGGSWRAQCRVAGEGARRRWRGGREATRRRRRRTMSRSTALCRAQLLSTALGRPCKSTHLSSDSPARSGKPGREARPAASRPLALAPRQVQRRQKLEPEEILSLIARETSQRLEPHAPVASASFSWPAVVSTSFCTSSVTTIVVPGAACAASTAAATVPKPPVEPKPPAPRSVSASEATSCGSGVTMRSRMSCATRSPALTARVRERQKGGDE